jgi:hypothetical protein
LHRPRLLRYNVVLDGGAAMRACRNALPSLGPLRRLHRASQGRRPEESDPMRTLKFLLLTVGLLALPGSGSAHRELGAHEHGRGTLNIAIEGNRVSMELEVPGDDIVGFEHAARTRQQKAAVEKAKEQLAAPLSLFKLPDAAGCRATEAKVELEGGDHAKEEKGAKGEKGKAHADDGHNQFHAQYTLECTAPAGIAAIEFAYFRSFARAKRLDVNVITAKGQTKFEVTRAKPRISLAGMI